MTSYMFFDAGVYREGKILCTVTMGDNWSLTGHSWTG